MDIIMSKTKKTLKYWCYVKPLKNKRWSSLQVPQFWAFWGCSVAKKGTETENWDNTCCICVEVKRDLKYNCSLQCHKTFHSSCIRCQRINLEVKLEPQSCTSSASFLAFMSLDTFNDLEVYCCGMFFHCFRIIQHFDISQYDIKHRVL